MTTPDLLLNNYKRLIEVNETFLKTLENEFNHNIKRYEKGKISYGTLNKLQYENQKEKLKTNRHILFYQNKIFEIEKQKIYELGRSRHRKN